MTRVEALSILNDYFSEGLVITIAEALISAEREACARICEDMSNTEANMNKTWRNGCKDCSDSIRARGKE